MTIKEITMDVTEAQAQKFCSLLEHGLVQGLGTPEPGKMCIEAAWCVALGLPHGDDPGCVMEPLRRLKIRLNDATWSSNDARAQGLKRLGLIQIGSKGMDQKEFRDRINLLRIRMLVPIRFRIAASKQTNKKHAATLKKLAELCETSPGIESAEKARDGARKVRGAAYAAYSAAAAAYAYAAAYAADAADAAADAADAAADAYAARDKVLGDFAEAVVQILIGMGAPGTKWLYLAPTAGETYAR